MVSNLPEYVMVGPHRLAVNVEGCFIQDGSKGSANLVTGTITIDENLPESKKWDILWHEVLEYIDDQYNLELSHDKLTTIACQMFQFWWDNLAAKDVIDNGVHTA